MCCMWNMTERLSTMAYECIILRFAHGLFWGANNCGPYYSHSECPVRTGALLSCLAYARAPPRLELASKGHVHRRLLRAASFVYVDNEWDEFRCYFILGFVLDSALDSPAITWTMEAQTDIHKWLGDWSQSGCIHTSSSKLWCMCLGVCCLIHICQSTITA
jgi:hypothetical protein